MTELTFARAAALLSYDPATGVLAYNGNVLLAFFMLLILASVRSHTS